MNIEREKFQKLHEISCAKKDKHLADIMKRKRTLPIQAMIATYFHFVPSDKGGHYCQKTGNRILLNDEVIRAILPVLKGYSLEMEVIEDDEDSGGGYSFSDDHIITIYNDQQPTTKQQEKYIMNTINTRKT